MAERVKTEEEIQQEIEAQAAQAAEEAGAEAQAQGATPEEVKAAVEKARKEEKDKLYSQIEELKAQTREVQEHLRAEREEKERIQKEAEEKAEKARLAKLSDADRLSEQLKRFEEQLKKSQEQYAELERKNTEREKRDQLDRYREAQIKSAEKDGILTELVRGDSYEEIDRSIEIAKARYKELEETFKTKFGTSVRTGMPGPTNPDTEALDEEELERQLDSLDIDTVRYEKDRVHRTEGGKYVAEIDRKREQLAVQVAAAYQKAAGR